MNGRQISILAGLAMALLCISACKSKILPGVGKGPGPGHHFGRQDPRVFEVYIYADPTDPSNKCLADWPVGTLWQGRHQTVEWFSDDGGEYTVDFNQGHHPGSKSPFAGTTFDVPSNGSIASKLVPGASGYYDFAIRSGGANGNICKDPSDPGYLIKP
jgi:hypothetical protein